jgi:hypothetical protein
MLMRTAGVEQPIDDGLGKPANIWARTGRRPVMAGGNADGTSRRWSTRAPLCSCITTFRNASSRMSHEPRKHSRLPIATDGRWRAWHATGPQCFLPAWRDLDFRPQGRKPQDERRCISNSAHIRSGRFPKRLHPGNR